MPKTRLPLREITATARLALTVWAAQVMHHQETVCPVRSCRRHRCCAIGDARTGTFLCILLLYEDERRAFDAALSLAEHLCLHFFAGDLAGWYQRRLLAGAALESVSAAVEIVARMLPESDVAAAEFRAFFRKHAKTRGLALRYRSGTESGNGTGCIAKCNHSSSV